MERELIGQRIKRLRESLPSTQAAFARQLGMWPSTLCMIETGRRKPTLRHCRLIALGLMVGLEFLLSGTD